MKKLMLSFVLALGLILFGAEAHAADTGTIMVTVSLASETSVTLTPTSWAIGAITLGSVNGPTSFTATVGNSATKLEIKGTNALGGWTLGAPAGIDRFQVSVTSPAMNLTPNYQVLAPSVAAYSSQSFGLTYRAPTQDTKGGGIDQSFSITVKASAP